MAHPMAARRHLPVLQNTAPSASPTAETAPEDPPPWHWIPLGSVVSVVTFALLAQGAATLSTRLLSRVYRPGLSVAEIAAIRSANPVSAYGTELVAGVVPLVALLASVGLGGYFIGRYGERTNARHGTLSGACTGLLFWLVTGRLSTMLAVIPFAMLAGWAAALGGTRVRDR